MRLRSNVHTHTNFCDGKDTPLEMALEAVKLGFTDLGFSSHSYAPFDAECLGLLKENEYKSEIKRLKQHFAGTLNVLLGAEQDFFAPVARRQDFDYLIGSVHYLRDKNGKYHSVDGTREEFAQMLKSVFSGNIFSLLDSFFSLSAENVKIYRPEIIGHFDIVTKNNGGNFFWNEEAKEYRDIALSALDNVIVTAGTYGGMFELNFGAVARGYRKTPYPSRFLLKRLAEKNARVIVTSDCHAKEALNFGFDSAPDYLKEIGFKSLAVLKDGKFVDEKIS